MCTHIIVNWATILILTCCNDSTATFAKTFMIMMWTLPDSLKRASSVFRQYKTMKILTATSPYQDSIAMVLSKANNNHHSQVKNPSTTLVSGFPFFSWSKRPRSHYVASNCVTCYWRLLWLNFITIKDTTLVRECTNNCNTILCLNIQFFCNSKGIANHGSPPMHSNFSFCCTHQFVGFIITLSIIQLMSVKTTRCQQSY